MRQKKNGKLVKIAVAVLMAAMAISGCGKGSAGQSGQAGTSTQTGQAGQGGQMGVNASEQADGPHYYQVQETMLPDMERSLLLSLPEDGWLGNGWPDQEPFYAMGENLYRTFTVWGYMEVDGTEMPALMECGIQYIEPPYAEWTNLLLDSWKWEEDGYWGATEFRVTRDQRMLVLLKEYWGEEILYALGEVHRDGTQELVKKLSEEEATGDWTGLGLAGESNGILQSEAREKILQVGVDAYSAQYAWDGDGVLFFADVRGLWRYGKSEPVQLFTFTDGDIVLDKIHGLSVTEEGFLVMGSYKDKNYLLRLTEVQEPVSVEKEEIVFAETLISAAMKEVIVNFNRQSKDYRVVTRTVPDSEFGLEGVANFASQLQMEISAGKGPDIIGMGVLTNGFESYASKGFLEPLDSVTEGDDDLLESAMQSGVVDGVRYGLPMRYNVMFLGGSKDLIEKRRSWDAREMMKAVEESGAEYLAFMDFVSGEVADGPSIVYYFGLTDNADKTYIDWEAGVSHLTEEPFLELLEFAKKYAVKGEGMSRSEADAALRDGRIALTNIQVVMLYQLLGYEDTFSGNDAFIGYPSVEGSGVYLLTFDCYLNASSQHKEGAKEFLRYLLTEEAQLMLTEVAEGGSFPVRKSTLETNLALAQRNLESGGSKKKSSDYALSKEQADRFLEMVRRAKNRSWKVETIEDMVLEELDAYFAGKRSAEETARILDNRMQLYLDENK